MTTNRDREARHSLRMGKYERLEVERALRHAEDRREARMERDRCLRICAPFEAGSLAAKEIAKRIREGT